MAATAMATVCAGGVQNTYNVCKNKPATEMLGIMHSICQPVYKCRTLLYLTHNTM